MNTRDGLNLLTRIIRPKNAKKVCLMALPLGAEGFEIYHAIIATLKEEFIYISWDYRGMF